MYKIICTIFLLIHDEEITRLQSVNAIAMGIECIKEGEKINIYVQTIELAIE